MPGGRPRLPGTAEERAQRQRERIKQNVRLHRQRRREAKLYEKGLAEGDAGSLPADEQLENIQAARPRDQRLSSTTRMTRTQKCDSNMYLNWLSHHLPFRLPFGPSYTDAFCASSFDTFSAEGPSTSKACLPLDLTCGPWIRHVYNNLPLDITKVRILEEASLSSALRNIKGLRTEPGFRAAMLEAHTRSVQKVGHLVNCQLNGTQKLGPYSLAGTIMAFAVAELVVHSSWDRFEFHIHGAGAIFEATGPAGLSSKSSRMYFNGFRAMALPFALMNRRADFVCKAEWFGLHPHGSNDDYRVRISTFMDIVYQVPPIMEEYDLANPKDRAVASDQLRRVLIIRMALVDWKNSVCPDDPWRCMASTVDHCSSPTSTFPTDCMANLLIAYCGASIVINELCADIAIRISGHQNGQPPALVSEFAAEMRNWVEKTCWSLQFLSEEFPRCVGKMNCLFSLHASWDACAKLSTWNKDVRATADRCRRLGSHFQTIGFPLFPGAVTRFD